MQQEKDINKDNHRPFIMKALIVVFVFVFSLSFMLGRYPILPWEFIRIIGAKIFPIARTWKPQMETILFQVRFPRIFMTALIGAGLSCAGAVLQGVFHNPMVSPEMLGASAGAGFGAALALILSLSSFTVSLYSFGFGLLAVAIVCFIDKTVHSPSYLTIVLAGVVVKALFTEGISFIKLVADTTDTLPAITYWLMGSLASIRMEDVMLFAPVIIIGMIPLVLLRWKINVMTMGDDAASSMGLSVKKLRLCIIIAATLITAACVCVSGMIGWVGLVVPHLARMLVGPDYRKLISASMLLGATYLLIVDNFARLMTTSEIPIGILTAFFGAPFFLYLIMREGKRT